MDTNDLIIAQLQEQMKRALEDIKELDTKVEAHTAMLAQFPTVRSIVYGFVYATLMAVAAAIFSLILKN